MSLLYRQIGTGMGRWEYARRPDGKWFARHLSRTKSGGVSPDKWRPYRGSLEQAIVNPTMPPNSIKDLRLVRDTVPRLPKD